MHDYDELKEQIAERLRDAVLKIAHALAIDPSWLAFGVGRMDLRPGIARALERKSQPKQAASK